MHNQLPRPRRWAAALLAAVWLTAALSGCNRAEEERAKTPVVTAFTCQADGSYRGEAVAGSLQRTAAGLLTVTLTEPATLEGLVMTWDGENVTLKMLGLEWTVDEKTVPQAALGMRVLRALDAVTYGQSEGSLTDDGRLKTTGTAGDAADSAEFALYSDPDTGALLSLEVPAEELTLTFSDFQC